MSLILDALNKADNERSSGDAPTIKSAHDHYPLREENHTLRWAMVLLIGFIVLLSLLVVYLIASRDTPAAPAGNIVTAPQHQTPAQTMAALQKTAAENVASPATVPAQNTTTEETASTYALMRQKQIAAQYAAAEQQREDTDERTATRPVATEAQPQKQLDTPVTEARSNPAIASIYQGAAASGQHAQNSTSTHERAPEKPRASERDTLARFSTLRFLNDLPLNIQQGIPTLRYSAHNYASRPASVTINNRQFTVNDAIAEGVVLEAITEDGIVLRSGETRFRMYALNSWINM